MSEDASTEQLSQHVDEPCTIAIELAARVTQKPNVEYDPKTDTNRTPGRARQRPQKSPPNRSAAAVSLDWPRDEDSDEGVVENPEPRKASS